MNGSSIPNLYLALVHYPVINKHGDVIASAVTNLDVHDIARAAATYGVRGFYVVTPLVDQITLIGRLISHWTNGAGATYNPQRRRALELVRIKENLDDVLADIRGNSGGKTPPRTVVTSARNQRVGIGFETLRRMIGEGHPYLLVFGTAWGLTEALISAADFALVPVKGPTSYNHLSVRSAVTVILDRLLGR
ncbi:MAG: RNA methyltransferase [Desulfobacterales bacterium]